MTSHLPRAAGELQLERTAPYIPAVSFPGIADVVLTDGVKDKLSALIPELSFRPVQKVRIVRLDWSGWDTAAEEPAVLPASGEPKDYVLSQRHDHSASENLGSLWELVADIDPGIQASRGKFVLSKYRDQHLVRAHASGGYNFVSSALRDSLLRLAPAEVTFRIASH
jgi:hypothetical protein